MSNVKRLVLATRTCCCLAASQTHSPGAVSMQIFQERMHKKNTSLHISLFCLLLLRVCMSECLYLFVQREGLERVRECKEETGIDGNQQFCFWSKKFVFSLYVQYSFLLFSFTCLKKLQRRLGKGLKIAQKTVRGEEAGV